MSVSGRAIKTEQDRGKKGAIYSQWKEMAARASEIIIPGALKIMTFLRPMGSTIRRARQVKTKFTDAMMSPVAVGLSNPTALKSVAE